MMGWIIEAALASQVFENVYVSTESKEIASIATLLGAKIPYLRPIELAHDEVPMSRVGVDLIQFLQQKNETYDFVCIANPSFPLTTADDFRCAYDLFRKSGAEVLHGIAELEYHPERSLKIVNGLLLPALDFAHLAKQSQELTPSYQLTGISFLQTPYFLSSESYYAKDMVGFLMAKRKAMDVHTEEDLSIAECLLYHANSST